MVNLSKKYRQAVETADLHRGRSLEDAVALLEQLPKAKFDETVELAFHLGVDPRQSDQMVRGVVMLPNGSGKQVDVLVFTEKPEEALQAGAKYAGLEDLIEKVQGGWTAFDVALATPSAMKEVRKIARVLGPRGLMPNPKSGTVTDDIAQAIRDSMGGRVEFKMDKTANLQVVVGKRSFVRAQLVENIQTALETVGRARPEAFKGRFIRSATLAGTMTPGIRLEAGVYSKY